MCAPRDQRKSSDNQREQAELNALRCRRRPMCREGSDLVRLAANLRQSRAEGSIRGISDYGTAASGAQSGHRTTKRRQ